MFGKPLGQIDLDFIPPGPADLRRNRLVFLGFAILVGIGMMTSGILIADGLAGWARPGSGGGESANAMVTQVLGPLAMVLCLFHIRRKLRENEARLAG